MADRSGLGLGPVLFASEGPVFGWRNLNVHLRSPEPLDCPPRLCIPSAAPGNLMRHMCWPDFCPSLSSLASHLEEQLGFDSGRVDTKLPCHRFEGGSPGRFQIRQSSRNPNAFLGGVYFGRSIIFLPQAAQDNSRVSERNQVGPSFLAFLLPVARHIRRMRSAIGHQSDHHRADRARGVT